MAFPHASIPPVAGRCKMRAGLLLVMSTGGALLLIVAGTGSAPAFAAGPGLASAAAYSVLAGSTVTNTGPSVLSGDLGVSPGTAVTGFSTATIGGATHAGDAEAAQAQSDLTAAYSVTAGLTPTETSLGSALVGGVHDPGVYNASSALDLSGAVTLDGHGNPNAVFVFQIGAGFTTASNASIVLIGAAQACNAFWQIGSSATLGTNTAFVGTIMALTSITLTTGTTVQGRALARNGAVTLDDNVFTAPSCATTTPSPTTTAPASTPATSGPTTTTAPPTATTAPPTTPAQPTTISTPTGALTPTGAANTAGAAGRAAAAARAAARGAARALPGGSEVNNGSGLVPTSTPKTLASTGVSSVGPLLLTSAALLTLGGALLATGHGRRRTRRTPPVHRA